MQVILFPRAITTHMRLSPHLYTNFYLGLYAMVLLTLAVYDAQFILRAESIQSPNDYYQAALQAEKEKNYRKALGLYHKALAKNPKHLDSRIGEARVYFSLGLPNRSKDIYQNILSTHPHKGQAKIGLAKVLIGLEELAKAHTLLSPPKKEFDGIDLEYNHTLGLWHTKKGNLKLAKLYFNRALNIDPMHLPALTGMANLFIRRNLIKQAMKYFQQAKGIEPHHLDIYKTQSYLHLHLAWSQKDKGLNLHHLTKVRDTLQIAQTISPQDGNIQLELIQLDFYLGHYHQAEQAILRLLAQDDFYQKNAKLHYLKGLLGLHKNQISKAVSDLSKALHLEPENSLIRHRLEMAVMKHANRLGGAKTLLSKLARYHFQKANKMRANYRRDIMETHLSRVLHLSPQHKRALWLQLELLKDKKDYEASLLIRKQLYKLDSKNIKLFYRLEQALQEKKQNIAYRERLFNPFRSTEKATFQRTPAKIFIFDFVPSPLSLGFADMSQLITNSLYFTLQRPGPLLSISQGQREKVLHYTHTYTNESRQGTNDTKPHPTLFYHAAHLEALGHIFKGKQAVRYLLSGRYHRTLDGINQIKLILRDGHTGNAIHRFQVQSTAPETVLHLMTKIRQAILKRIPIEGKIIKHSRDKIFINLGTYDGLQKKDRLFIIPISTKKTALQVEELGAYTSRVSLSKSFRTQILAKNAPVRLLR